MNLPKTLIQLLLGKRLPVLAGELEIPGLTNPITIHRDGFGVPYIRAKSEADAWYGLGFCQGQDRGFQLEMLLRVTRGTLSEILGERTLQIDRLSRRIGFHRAAQGHTAELSGDSKAIYQAFVTGINDGFNYGCPKLPHEFVLLRTKPTAWSVEDVLAGMNYIAFGLSSWSAKLTRLLLFEKEGLEAIKALDSDNVTWREVTTSTGMIVGEKLNHLFEDLERMMEYFGSGASNNWALTSAHTRTGYPLLANDPHLAPTLPAPWYLAHLYFPGLTLCGSSFVGAPILPSGFNGHMAWGVSAGLVDNIDIFYEQIGEDGKTVRQADGFVDCEVIKEIFVVKGQAAVEEDILITPRGPIISDVIDEFDMGVSLRATWMTPRPADGITAFHHAKTPEEFFDAGGRLRLASINLIFAKSDETLGWMLMGETPLRSKDWGTLARPGWEIADNELEKFLPWAEMPKVVNPDVGYIATANNKPYADGTGPYLGRDWADGYRLSRIIELLNSKTDWDLETTLEMQSDRFSIPWREMKDVVLNLDVKNSDAKVAQDILQDWDGIISADSLPAAIYEYFVIEMIQRMAEAKAPGHSEWVLGKVFNPLIQRSFFPTREVSHLVRYINDQPNTWFEDGWGKEIDDAMEAAMIRLREHFRAEPNRWNWGFVHELVMRHPIGTIKVLSKVYNRGPFPYGGDHQTIAQGGRLSSVFGSNVTAIANLRMAVNVGAWWDNYFVLAGGQSGNPFSPHYDDLLQYWLEGKAVTVAWRGHAISRATEHILELKPK